MIYNVNGQLFSAEPQPGTPAPSLRRAPLYDSNHYPEEPPAASEKPADNRGQDDAPDRAPEQTGAARGRRDPFGPPTSRQAIIDLSARKRPRSPYSS